MKTIQSILNVTFIRIYFPDIGIGKTTVLMNVLLIFVLSSCNNSIFETPNDDVILLNDSASAMFISPEHGGVLKLPNSVGGGSLDIPPGAVDKKTKISVSALNQGIPGRVSLGFEPLGLTFNKPVRLSMHFKTNNSGDPRLLSFIHVSKQNEPIDAGHELHYWAPLENLEVDATSNTISGDMEHFSEVYLTEDHRLAYLVLDIPGVFLRPGDGLFVLSGERTAELIGKWSPGHAGMIRSVDRKLGKITVIESTINGGPKANVTGVQLNTFLSFKRNGHLYMGARRPKGKIMSDGERITAIGFGDLQLGKPYRPWGTLPADIGTGWICTGLLEGCWKEANRSTQGTLDFIPMPSEMYETTVPVSEISVKVGEEIRIPVYPVVVSHGARWTSHTYQTGVDVPEKVSISGQPENAEWKEDLTHPYRARTLSWTPEPKDAGNSYTVAFKIAGSRFTTDGNLSFDVTQELTIHVRGGHKYLSIYPAGRGETGLLYAYGLTIPQGAIIDTPSTEHLIDVETGKHPVNPVFENQILENYREDWYNKEIYPNYYGPKFRIKRLDSPQNPTPSGVRSWLYWIDFKVPWYDGLN